MVRQGSTSQWKGALASTQAVASLLLVALPPSSAHVHLIWAVVPSNLPEAAERRCLLSNDLVLAYSIEHAQQRSPISAVATWPSWWTTGGGGTPQGKRSGAEK